MFPGDVKKLSWRTKLKFIVKNFLVRVAYLRFSPTVIAVTGSMSKSTTVNFTCQLLKELSEEGVETNVEVRTGSSGARRRVLGISKSKNFFELVLNTFRASTVFLRRRFPKYFVFEFRSQCRGRIEFASRSLKPEVGVLMWVVPAHAEYFGTLDDIYQEKVNLIKLLPKEGTAVLNYDDLKVRNAKNLSKAKVIFFGLSPKADIWAENIHADFDGLRAIIHYRGKNFSLRAKNIINQHHIYPVLASCAVLLSQGYSIEKIIGAIERLQPMNQRANLEKGIRGSILINETFNANPKSVTGSLEMLASVAKSNRKIAVLGDMLEQGKYQEAGHKKVGEKAVGLVDELILVGKNSLITAQAAKENGMASRYVHWYATADDAADFLSKLIKKDDFILFKGSNAMKIDRLLENVKAEKGNG